MRACPINFYDKSFHTYGGKTYNTNALPEEHERFDHIPTYGLTKDTFPEYTFEEEVAKYHEAFSAFAHISGPYVDRVEIEFEEGEEEVLL